jgi:hypothetical protein
MPDLRKEAIGMTIIDRLKTWVSYATAKIQAAWSRWEEQGTELQGKVLDTVGGFLTSPLTETEYAVLKRVSGIMGTAVAVYITLMAGFGTALVVFGLCLVLMFGLYKIASRTPGERSTG